MCADELEGFRAPTEREAGVLRFLLAVDFQGAEVLRRQLASIHVKPIDRDGGLALHPADLTQASVSQRIPTEATHLDADGVVVHVLLHVVDGSLNELEFFREDGQDVITPADSSMLSIAPWIT